jgi:hypothetical protein
MPKKSKLYSITIKSESGDDYGAFVFNRKPSEEELKKWLFAEFEGSYDLGDGDEGPGIFDTFLHIETEDEMEVYNLDKGKYE